MNENDRLSLGKKASWIGIIGNILLTALKAIIGFISGSTAMVADALHSGSDIVATTIVLHGIKISHRPPDQEHHYGHGKAESIVAKIIAIILMITGMGIGLSAYHSLKSPNLTSPDAIAIWAAVLSIVVKEWMYRYTVKIGERIESQALVADAWHHRTDAFSSIAALIGITGAVLGYPILDPIAGIIVAFMIVKAGFSIYLDAINELMDTAPSKEVMDRIKKTTLSVDGVRSVHKIRARKNGNQIYVDLVICVDKYITVEKGHQFAAQAKYNILNTMPNIKDVVIHVDPYPLEDNDHSQEKR
ncbi:cation diffusion facilitator family transporter [Crassaminicella profunda]|uniref:cation diffusion facilitator family transporter n=1 Tax=Crassaminicella profunda TaxID=1286698 RepID=UPI001CA756DA|nr:cation diffusion facilitator family transporter [Crassaminicella profunda]QZY57216.1 cation diffusion facilitator family transporter [Crassaminicella profunda]